MLPISLDSRGSASLTYSILLGSIALAGIGGLSRLGNASEIALVGDTQGQDTGEATPATETVNGSANGSGEGTSTQAVASGAQAAGAGILRSLWGNIRHASLNAEHADVLSRLTELAQTDSRYRLRAGDVAHVLGHDFYVDARTGKGLRGRFGDLVDGTARLTTDDNGYVRARIKERRTGSISEYYLADETVRAAETRRLPLLGLYDRVFDRFLRYESDGRIRRGDIVERGGRLVTNRSGVSSYISRTGTRVRPALSLPADGRVRLGDVWHRANARPGEPALTYSRSGLPIINKNSGRFATIDELSSVSETTADSLIPAHFVVGH
ncbi:MAG: hypothetical protein KC416_00830 [Myxococcales bacterium]|nr:hypothetical protein [Myxococcales bacterium]